MTEGCSRRCRTDQGAHPRLCVPMRFPLLGPGAFSSPSDVMRLCDIFFGKWSGKSTVSILILWISSVAD